MSQPEETPAAPAAAEAAAVEAVTYDIAELMLKDECVDLHATYKHYYSIYLLLKIEFGSIIIPCQI